MTVPFQHVNLTLTPLELVIMKSLWRRRTAVVREVRADLLPDRELAYTTVLTVMDRLFKKGAVRRKKKSRFHVYEPALTEAGVRAHAVANLVDSFFEGSSRSLRVYLEPEQGIRSSKKSRRVAPPSRLIDDFLL